MSGPLDPKMLLQGYAAGIFPMSDARDADDIFWVEPRRRAILPPGEFHCSRSLARTIRQQKFTVTRDRDFHGVVLGCADRPETWINRAIEQATLGLHAAGNAHSVECWRGGELVGGIYGVKLGAAFFGESMFSRTRDASKVALAWLVARLKVGGFTLFDCQFITDHLASLGARSVSRDAYVGLLATALSAGGGGGASVAGTSTGGTPTAAPPDFFALDPLLTGASDGSAPAGAGGPDGKLIAQLLGHTS